MPLFETYLALDASTEMCSVALCVRGKLYSRQCDIPKSHAKVLLPMLQELLQEHSISLKELDAIVVSRGPGSFTGIRICLSLAQGLAYGCQLPLVSLDSLTCLAKYTADTKSLSSGLIIAALDARMDELYWAAFNVENALLEQVVAPVLSSPVDFLEQVNSLIKDHTDSGPIVGVGHGWTLLDKAVLDSDAAEKNEQSPKTDALVGIGIDTTLLPHALGAARIVVEEKLGEISQDGIIEPLYLRNEVAWEKRKRIRTSPPVNL